MSIFRPLSIMFSSHPYMTDQYLELAVFASERASSSPGTSRAVAYMATPGRPAARNGCC